MKCSINPIILITNNNRTQMLKNNNMAIEDNINGFDIYQQRCS